MVYNIHRKSIYSSILTASLALATLHSEFSKMLAQQLQCRRPREEKSKKKKRKRGI